MPLTSAYPGPLSVLIMDNAHIHHGDKILVLADCFMSISQMYALQVLIDMLPLVSGVRIEYLSPYSPDLNPIEEAFSKIKAFICHGVFFLSVENVAIIYDMYIALDIIILEDATGYFIHAGYF